MAKRRVLIETNRQNKIRSFSYVSLGINDITVKKELRADILEIKNEIEEIKPLTRRLYYLKKELEEAETLLKLLEEKETEQLKNDIE